MTGYSPRTTTQTGDRASRRAFVRANHPDVGGDTAEFVAGLERLRRKENTHDGSTEHSPDRYDAPIEVVVRKRGVTGAVSRWRTRRKRPRRVV